jgi:hypothetical protein
MVTHDSNIASQADAIVRIEDGRVSLDSWEDFIIYNKYKLSFVLHTGERGSFLSKLTADIFVRRWFLYELNFVFLDGVA